MWARTLVTGIGIPAEMQPRIFEMFTQIGTSFDRAQGGLGIGLTLVKRRKLCEPQPAAPEDESEFQQVWATICAVHFPQPATAKTGMVED